MTASELAGRMRAWLKNDYTALLFEQDGEVLAYALYRPSNLLRHICANFSSCVSGGVRCRPPDCEDTRNKSGAPDVRLTVDVLATNTASIFLAECRQRRRSGLTLEIMPSL